MTTPTDARVVPESWRRALGWLPPAVYPGQVLVGPDAEVVHVTAGGRLERILPPGYPRPGIAADPDPGRRP